MATAPQIQCKASGSVRNIAVSFSGMLDSGELLTGTPVVIDVASVLSIDTIAISSAILDINDVDVPAGEAVQFRINAGGVADTIYSIKITVTTDSSPAQTLIGCVELEIIPDC